MRTKRQGRTPGSDAAPPSTIEGERTVIHVGPEAIHQRHPRQIRVRGLSFLDVIGYVVMASALALGAFMAFAFLMDRLRDWLSV